MLDCVKLSWSAVLSDAVGVHSGLPLLLARMTTLVSDLERLVRIKTAVTKLQLEPYCQWYLFIVSTIVSTINFEALLVIDSQPQRYFINIWRHTIINIIIIMIL